MLLNARGITKSFGSTRALVSVDLSIARGEIVALAGENGSGKSTLSRILSGAIRPDGGEFQIDNQRVSFGRPSDAMKMGVSIVTQEVTSVPNFSVAENVMLQTGRPALSIYRRRNTERLARQLMEEVGLDAHPSTPFASLSPANAVLAEVARALGCKPKLLILDEATSQIGGQDVERLFSLMRRLAQDGIGLVIVTHRLGEVLEIADRTVVLRDGRRVGELGRREATEQRISSMMVGRDIESHDQPESRKLGAPQLEVRNLGVVGMQETVSFSVSAGELVGLSGLVGSGRTEILETIAGLRPAWNGSVCVQGTTIRLGSVKSIGQAGMALVPEDRRRQALMLEASVSANVALGTVGALMRTNTARDRRLVQQYGPAVKLRIPPLADPPAKSLSGGNQQKVVFARALALHPRVLLLDEPTRGIDVGAREEIFKVIAELLGSGTAILMASSDMRELLALSDRIIVLHDRKLVAEVARALATEEDLALLAGGGR